MKLRKYFDKRDLIKKGVDAFNLFIQQSINVEGLPFIVTQNSKETMREQALLRLLMELSLGEESAKSEGWISEDAIAKKFGVKL